MDITTEPSTSYADRLRALADLIDATPEFATAADNGSLPTITVHGFDPEAFHRLVALLPAPVSFEAKEQYNLYYAESFGIQIVGSLDRVCDRTQIGVTPLFDWTLRPAPESVELAAAS